MRKLLIAIMLVISTSSFAQVFLKSGIGVGYSTPVGFLTEADLGYKRNNHQVSGGYFYNSAVTKAFYNLKYGYWWNDFVFYGGVALVNRFENRPGTYYVSAYGTYIAGMEYNTVEVLQDSRLYFGLEVADANIGMKAGIKVFFNR